MRVARCSEFPNDNPALHEGAIWLCEPIGAAPSCELRAPDPVEPEVEDEAGTIEVVQELTFEEPVDELGPADWEGGVDEQNPPVATDPFEAFAGILVDVASASGADVRAVGCLRALLGQSRLDAIVLDESATEALVAGGLVVRTDRGIARTPAFTGLVVAWQGILRGECEDFGPCGAATLDEWSAGLVARVLGATSRTEGIRRELRRRGVAAFGFVADAA